MRRSRNRPLILALAGREHFNGSAPGNANYRRIQYSRPACKPGSGLSSTTWRRRPQLRLTA
jgi:hypothetical protein